MSDHVLTEEPLQFGEGGRSFGILTLPGVPPRDARELPVFVILSAGLLHRVGPHRLHVRLARELAQLGFRSLRVDLAGNGESLPRPGLTNQQSVAADYEDILEVLESHLGRVPIVLAGLCSGADNSIRLALEDPRVVGMVLLDPVCDQDAGFKARAVVRKYTNPARYFRWLKRRIRTLKDVKSYANFAQRIAWLKRRVKTLTDRGQDREKPVDYVALRDLPTRQQMRAAFDSIRERGGRVLSVFTGYALLYCNQQGQLRRVLGIEGYEQFCTELFWPHAEHTYVLELHRGQVIEEIKTWAAGYIRP